MLQSRMIAIPSPLDQMAHALSTARSCRMTLIATRAVSNAVMRRGETIFIRRGAALEAYTTQLLSVQGRVMSVETVEKPGAIHTRDTSNGSWQASASQPDAATSEAQLVQILEPLQAIEWKDVGHYHIRGQDCIGYEAIGEIGEMQVQALLWIGQETMYPVELTVITDQPDAAHVPSPLMISEGTTLVDVVIWDAWDDVAIAIPPV